MDREETIRIARLAKDVRSNEAYQYAVEHIANELFVAFLASDPDGEMNREKLWAQGQALELINRKLDAYIQNGDLEQSNKSADKGD